MSATLRAGLVLALAAAGSVTAQVLQTRPGFPHPAHDGLFPTCQGCHGPVEAAPATVAYPGPERCAACHDGVREPTVDWEGPAREPSNLAFDHALHASATETEAEPLECRSCHGLDEGSGRMDVGRASPAACASCHAHAELRHPSYGEACSRCHRPLAETSLSADRIATFPRPLSHELVAFVGLHGPDADDAATVCATCHTRDTCLRCHANGDDLEAIRALAPDARVATLVEGLDPVYPEPVSHEEGDWSWSHGGPARTDVASCANCHTRPSCAACHGETTDAPFGLLPPRRPGAAPGVTLDRQAARSRVHRPGFQTGHGVDAATGTECASCHAESFCQSCHAGAETPGFHPANFLESHGSRVYAADTECVSCHNTEVFCRACHRGAGLTARGPLQAGYHTSEPFWLLGHGQAARRGLEGCAACHAQVDCARCHSAVGGWGVSPHGPDFDPERALDKAPSGCILCHRSLGGR